MQKKSKPERSTKSQPYFQPDRVLGSSPLWVVAVDVNGIAWRIPVDPSYGKAHKVKFE